MVIKISICHNKVYFRNKKVRSKGRVWGISMEYKLYVDEKEYPLSYAQIETIREVCPSPARAELLGKRITELAGLNFYIKDYQRGYRWSETEIISLLSDIEQIDVDEEGGEVYCMQPLVLKKLPEQKDDNADASKHTVRKKLGDSGEFPKGKSLPSGTYELLDGQQRITTIWLILAWLDIEADKEEPIEYSVYYELIRGVDEYFIEKAKKTIEKWFGQSKYNQNFQENAKKKSEFKWNAAEKQKFYSKLKTLFFIWYEVKDEESPAEKIFKSINEGKIELTNAELFKALLLNPDNAEGSDSKERIAKEQKEIAFEWDKLESGLRDDDFWYFISQNDVEKSSSRTRIDYVVEIYARELNKNENLGFDPHKDRFSFLAIQEYLNKENKTSYYETIKGIWENIVKVYDKLYSWYKDEELYHTIGFLVAAEESNRGLKSVVSEEVAKLYAETNTLGKEGVKKYVKKRIYKQIAVSKKENRKSEILLDDILYEYPLDGEEIVKRNVLRKILLFSNIFTMVFLKDNSDEEEKYDEAAISKTRFPFSIYNQTEWDIEHIRPRTVEKNLEKGSKNFEDFKSNLSALKDDTDDEEIVRTIDDYLSQDLSEENYKSADGYNECCSKWADYAEKLNQTPDHGIENLVLLNASINRSYGNAFFNKKRKKIIAQDQKGVFIPIVTKNVFMKYYSDSMVNPTQWTDEDKEGYRKILEIMLDAVKGWKE